MTTQRNLNLVWASNGGTSDPSDAKYTLGWEVEIPTFQNFNFVLNNNSRNILVGAEQRHHNWESSISYVSGAKVLGSDGTYYTCIVDNIGNDPTTDDINNYWITGEFISAGVSDDGVASLAPEQEHGFLLSNMGLSSTSDTWTTNDLTISNSSAFIGLYNKVAEYDNLVLGNSRGELVVFNAGETTSPDGRSVLPNNANVHRVYHEGNKPVIGDITGGVEEAPDDGKYYARKNKGWLPVTSTSVTNEPPPSIIGAGQGWFNLADGHLYIDINDGDSSQWVHANPPQVILSGEAPEGNVEEAPVDGKQYARKDAGWVEVEGGGGTSDFKMEDATDAELNIATDTDVSFNTISSSPQSGDGRYYQPTSTGPMVCSKVDSNGITVNAEVFNNQLCNIYYGGSSTPSATEVVTTTVKSNTIEFSFDDISLVSGGFRVETVNGITQPLQDGDVWQYNLVKEKFLPTQISTPDFKMEDATDAELKLSTTDSPVPLYVPNLQVVGGYYCNEIEFFYGTISFTVVGLNNSSFYIVKKNGSTSGVISVVNYGGKANISFRDKNGYSTSIISNGEVYDGNKHTLDLVFSVGKRELFLDGVLSGSNTDSTFEDGFTIDTLAEIYYANDGAISDISIGTEHKWQLKNPSQSVLDLSDFIGDNDLTTKAGITSITSSDTTYLEDDYYSDGVVIPLQDGDVWQYDASKEKFIPSQVSSSSTPTQIVNGGGSVVLNETGQLSINATSLNLATSMAGNFSSYLGVGGSYLIVAGDSDTAQGQDKGGSVTLRSGSSEADDGGSVLLEGGSCSVINSGSPSTPIGRSRGGTVRIQGGNGTETTTDGGNLSFEAGQANEGNGGAAFLKGGSNSSSTAKAGTLYLQAGINSTDESLSGEVHIAGGGNANSYINLKHDVIQVISPELNLENTTVEGGDASFTTLTSTILGTDTYDLPMDSPEAGQVLVAQSSSETEWVTPEPSVATVVVTEFPETPEPNTLYIKKDI